MKTLRPLPFTEIVHEACRLYESKMSVSLRSFDWLHVVINPSIRASVMFSLAASAGRSHFLWRNLLLHLFACDLSAGATIDGPVLLPHPLGIVIGKGVRLGKEVTIYQGVTLGTDGTGAYPKIGAGSIIYTGAVVVGGVSLPPGSRVKALDVITP